MQKTGEWREIERIKADAAPIDNVTKFAWDDDDYETVTVWHEYTQAELMEQTKQRVTELEQNLDKADYSGNKAIDALILECTTVDDILAVLARFREKYGKALEQKQEWRNEINALEDEEETT